MSPIERMRMLTDRGLRVVNVEPGASAASLIGSHWNAIKVFRDSGDASRLADFEGVVLSRSSIAGVQLGAHRFATDPAMIKHWAKQSELDIDDPYAEQDDDR